MLESMEPRDSSHLVPRYSRTFVRNAPKGQRKLSFRAADPPPSPPQFATRGNGKALLLLQSINFPCTRAFVCIDSKLALCSFENGLFLDGKLILAKETIVYTWLTVVYDMRWQFDELLILNYSKMLEVLISNTSVKYICIV